jgi:hypothetical protein
VREQWFDPPTRWSTLGTVPPGALVATRETLHHAAQLLALAAVSFIPAEADDSHTSMSWLAAHRALATQPIVAPSPIRIALRVPDLALLVIDDASGRETAAFALDGASRAEALAWIAARIGNAGLDSSRLRSSLHFTISPHATDTGAAFHADGDDLEELARWYGNASAFLEEYSAAVDGAGPVRCWPHHFDIAILVRLPGQRRLQTIGVGLSPGDQESDEPYFYVGPSPAPTTTPRPLSIGAWHTTSWWGAALGASVIVNVSDAAAQPALVRRFVDEAVERLLEGDGSRSVTGGRPSRE